MPREINSVVPCTRIGGFKERVEVFDEKVHSVRLAESNQSPTRRLQLAKLGACEIKIKRFGEYRKSSHNQLYVWAEC